MSSSDEVILEVEDVKKYFPIHSGIIKRKVGDVKAVDGVSFDLRSGETLGLVGESGCGKSTLGRCIVRLLEPTAGSVRYRGTDILELSSKEIRDLRSEIQVIFQDPASSLNPRMSVNDIIQEPMQSLTDWSAEERQNRAIELIEEVGLSVEHLGRAPHKFSGGQQQRIAIARALSVNPRLIVADEPTSALDVSVQAKILNLLRRLQEKYDLTYLFISHDLSVVRHVSSEVAVMYLGQIAEIADSETLFSNPKHPYTESLLSSIPLLSIGRRDDEMVLDGEVPSPEDPPQGCRFHTRCPEFIGEVCENEQPRLEQVSPGQQCACHLYTDVTQ
ncbi:ABC transporter ATP-binding protein [Natrialbaceae archaeon A-CW2]